MTTHLPGVYVTRERVAELLCRAIYGPGQHDSLMEAYGDELRRQADLLIEGLSVPPDKAEGECLLCADKCRHHRLGHPEDWYPEPGSRDYRMVDTYLQANRDAAQTLRSMGDEEAAALVETIPVDLNLPPLRSKSIIDAGVLATDLSASRRKKIRPLIQREGVLVDGTVYDRRGALAYRSTHLVRWQQLDIHHDALIAAIRRIDRLLTDQWRKQGGR